MLSRGIDPGQKFAAVLPQAEIKKIVGEWVAKPVLLGDQINLMVDAYNQVTEENPDESLETRGDIISSALGNHYGVDKILTILHDGNHLTPKNHGVAFPYPSEQFNTRKYTDAEGKGRRKNTNRVVKKETIDDASDAPEDNLLPEDGETPDCTSTHASTLNWV